MPQNADELLKIWDRFVDAATSEKGWMHDRLMWMFTPQGILFAAFILTLQNRFGENIEIVNFMRLMIPLVGLLISISVFLGVVAAGVMHWKWTSRLNDLAKEINADEPIIVTFGSAPHLPARSSSILPSIIALVFVAAWAAVIIEEII